MLTLLKTDRTYDTLREYQKFIDSVFVCPVYNSKNLSRGVDLFKTPVAETCCFPGLTERGRCSHPRSRNKKSRLRHCRCYLHPILFHNKMKDKIKKAMALSMFIDKYTKMDFTQM